MPTIAYTDSMSYDNLQYLRKNHAAWRLLAATNAPFAVAFFYETFLHPPRHEMPKAELLTALELFLEEHQMTQARTAGEYLNEWSDDAHGWLRHYYPEGKEGDYYDLKPQAEKAILWLETLEQGRLVGTESRLISVFHLLGEIADKTELNPAQRLATIDQQIEQLQKERDNIEQGHMRLLGDVQVKERYQQATRLSREILADFRQMEANFKALDGEFREKMTTWQDGKGALLEDFFAQEDLIENSEEGHSFQAFWQFLMSQSDQDRLQQLLDQILELPAVQSLPTHHEMLHMERAWQEGASRVQTTIASISRHLRRYLEESHQKEEQRLAEIITEIEKHALSLRECPPDGTVITLDGLTLELCGDFSRPLYSPRASVTLEDTALSYGVAPADADLLYAQQYLDRQAVQDNIDRALAQQEQVSLLDLLGRQPLTHGIAELLVYLQFAEQMPNATIDEKNTCTVLWEDENQRVRRAQFPAITYRN